MENKKRTLLAPLIYSDIFSFPLTLEEIQYYSVGAKRLSDTEAKRILASLYPLVQTGRGYYFLQGNKQGVTKRLRSHRVRLEKERQLRPTIRLLSQVPTVLFIGLSGSLAAGSAKPSDDIDLFIITKKHSLFVSRFLLLFLLQLSGKRRTRNMRDSGETVCLNMFMDQGNLRFPKNKQDIYTAREMTQMVPLYDKRQTYGTFLKKNTWVQSILPHATSRSAEVKKHKISTFERIGETCLASPLLEKIMRLFQLLYMRPHRTTEVVSSGLVAFHPKDHHYKTIKLYHQKTKQIEAILASQKRTRMMQLPDIDKEKNIFYTA